LIGPARPIDATPQRESRGASAVRPIQHADVLPRLSRRATHTHHLARTVAAGQRFGAPTSAQAAGPRCPRDVLRCPACDLVQHPIPVAPELSFRHYIHLSFRSRTRFVAYPTSSWNASLRRMLSSDASGRWRRKRAVQLPPAPGPAKSYCWVRVALGVGVVGRATLLLPLEAIVAPVAIVNSTYWHRACCSKPGLLRRIRWH
jgi:hypothetical protein